MDIGKITQLVSMPKAPWNNREIVLVRAIRTLERRVAELEGIVRLLDERDTRTTK